MFCSPDKAPVCKSLMIYVGCSHAATHIPSLAPVFRKIFTESIGIESTKSLLRLIASKLVFPDSRSTILVCFLVYFFRILERRSGSTITNVHPSVSQKAKHPESLKSSSFILHPFFVTFKLFSLFWVHFWYYLANILNINIYSPKFGSFQKGAQIDSRYPIVCCCLYLCLYTCKYVQYILVYRVHYW